jgi:hypothetical protein
VRRAAGQDPTKPAGIAPRTHGLPLVGAGRGRHGLAEPLGAVGVEEVLLRDAHG